MLHHLIFTFLAAAQSPGDLSLADILKYMSQIGLLGFMIIVIYGGYKRWWVFGWLYKESEVRTKAVERERDNWRDLALHGTNLAEQTVGLFKNTRDNNNEI